ncbi:MAG: type II CRISPR RNA-guided endonuclease Cas9, partial [Betaproteobacteria bacterium RIFCSPLOWO2_12_FULL_62_13]
KPRAAKALLEAQEYRLLEDLNNLEYHLPKQQGTFRLTPEEREKILQALSNPASVSERGQISWSETRKLIQKPKAKFNLERTSKNGLIGNRTALAITRLIPEKWTELGSDKAPGETYSRLQKALVHDLVHIENKLVLFNRLTNHYTLPPQRCPWHFSKEDAFALATLELEEGYVKHCRSVIDNLSPHLRGGMIYTDALTAAGYLRRDEIARKGLAELPEPPDIANPIVQKALFETRRVVNAIIRQYGRKPKIIRIEMAREMKASKSHRADIEKQQRANQKANDDAAEKITELAKTYPDLGIKVSREAILKYKLMLEQGRSCVYSSPERKIVDRMLFDGTVEIDHIYPLSVSLDDSYMNKVLSFRAENHEKGQRTPWQAWRKTDKYEEILKRLERLSDYPKGKLRRIKDDKFDPNADFVAAQLNDTRYICVAVRNYLFTLGYEDQHLQVSRGQMTAELRRLWGLSNILPRSADAGNVPEVNTDTGEIVEDKPEKDKKKDRGDHRHHAVDAIVTALVDRKVFSDLMHRYRYREERGAWPDAPLEPPVAGLRGEAERIVMDRVVSYAANRKVWGGLHDELPFGLSVWIEKSVPLKKLLRTPEVIRCEPDNPSDQDLEIGGRWVAQDEIRQVLRQWLDGYERASKRKDFPPPIMPDGSDVKEVDIANRCYVKRAPVKDALSRVENKPGQKTWIVDQGVRAALKEWQKTHRDKEAAIDPPRMPRADRNADKAHPIRTVRMATNASGLVRFRDRPQIFAKGSNHHVAIFKRILPDGTMERKGVYVDMLEAARRIREQPIIRKDPAQLSALDPSINLDAWRFEMASCSQDMVLWDANDVPNDQRNLGKPVYRLQKMSGANNSLIFRHFSVTSTSDKDRRGLIQRGPETLPASIRKIRVDALGIWEAIGSD